MELILGDRRNSWTQTVQIPNAEGGLQRFYLTCGEFPDGTLAEIWIDASREGTFIRGTLGAIAREFSLAIRNGTPIERALHALRGMDFPPQGKVIGEGTDVESCTSVPDWVAQEIHNVYVSGISRRPVRAVDRPPFDGTYENPSKVVRIVEPPIPNSQDGV